MTTIIVCDGGCGTQSPHPQTRLHVANRWLTVRAGYPSVFEGLDEHDDKQFCKACAPRILEALKPRISSDTPVIDDAMAAAEAGATK